MKNEELPKTIKEAREKGTEFYFTGKPCVHGHVDKRRSKSGHCMPCYKARPKVWAVNNPERAKIVNRESSQAARDKGGEEYRKYQQDYHKKWDRDNKEHLREYRKKYRQRKLEENRNGKIT